MAGVDGLVSEVDDQGEDLDSEFGLTLVLVPVMANYRLQAGTPEGKLGFFAGAGTGVSYLRLSGWGYNDNDWTLALQTFAGVEYAVSPKFALNPGVRYLWIDDASLAGVSAEVGDDVAIEIGFSLRL